jgi:hypothetical protein
MQTILLTPFQKFVNKMIQLTVIDIDKRDCWLPSYGRSDIAQYIKSRRVDRNIARKQR